MVTERDPSIDATAHENWREALAMGLGPSDRLPSSAFMSAPMLTAAQIARPTGPTAPQPDVQMPANALAVRLRSNTSALWLVGAHGGSGESTLAALTKGWVAADHTWPLLRSGGLAPCIVVARTHVPGLLAAQTALTQWAADGVGESVRLIGLVLVADAPGRRPAPIRDLAQVVAGGAPRVWDVPWIEDWRFATPGPEHVHRSVLKLVRTLRALAAAVQSDAASSL